MLKFPDGFLWGTATAAYQIEGAHDADGKGPSIWDTFSHIAGQDLRRTRTATSPAITTIATATTSALMAELGLNAYRFSVSWPRVIPGGTGAPNHAGARLLQPAGRRAAGAQHPAVHHAVPLGPAAGAGGPRRLGQRATPPAAFGEYAALMGRTLGDRVKDWITLNEPFAFDVAGYVFGIHAPGQAATRSWRFRCRTT